jgi:hypothetical protein
MSGAKAKNGVTRGQWRAAKSSLANRRMRLCRILSKALQFVGPAAAADSAPRTGHLEAFP